MSSILLRRLLSLLSAIFMNIPTLFPRTMVTLIYGYSLYVISELICINVLSLRNGLFVFCVTLMLWFHGMCCYFGVIRNGPGFAKTYAATETTTTVAITRSGRYCEVCHVDKPPRAHHCSSCDLCVLKMDHHCPWFAVCIGAQNHKQFIQFLISGWVFAVWSLLICGWYLWTFLKDESYTEEYLDLNIVLLAVLALCLSVSLGCFTGVELYFLLNNLTTIEYYERNRYDRDVQIMRESTGQSVLEWINVYDLGSCCLNWKAVMGETWKEWLLPVAKQNTTGDYCIDQGLKFPTKHSNNNNNNSNSSNGSGVRERLLGQLQTV